MLNAGRWLEEGGGGSHKGGVTLGRSLCPPLVSALNGDHVRPRFASSLRGRFPRKRGTGGPQGAGGTGAQTPPPPSLLVPGPPHSHGL